MNSEIVNKQMQLTWYCLKMEEQNIASGMQWWLYGGISGVPSGYIYIYIKKSPFTLCLSNKTTAYTLWDTLPCHYVGALNNFNTMHAKALANRQ